MQRTIALIIILAGVLPPAFAQERAKEATALHINDAIKVDGTLDEPAWQKADSLADFIQFQPSRGDPASVRTVIKVLYDRRYIYFGFFCYDTEPSKVVGRVTKRDADLMTDDAVSVCLDTFDDRRTCYTLMTNILGTQYDGRIIDNGNTTDTTWDGVWKSAGRRTDFGWSAEIAVELESLKFEPGPERTWGFQAGRILPRAMEQSYWTGPLEQPQRVSQFGSLTGMDLEKAGKKYQVIPHVISKFEEGKASQFEAGLDARYAFSQTVSGNLTINPDFATVEADQEQVNLTRFELNLPEKRNFFQEGSEIYTQRINLFYSRRIADIDAGVKLYGKSGRFEFTGLSAQAKKDDALGLDSANFTVVRVKGDVMKSSSIGFLAANRLEGGRNRGTAGIDASLNFTDTLHFTGQLALSYGDRIKEDVAFFLRPSYDTATFHFHVRYSQLGERFGDNANAVGFVQDDNRRELDSALTKTFWLRKGLLERIGYESNYNIYWGFNGSLRSWQVDQELKVDLKNKFSLGIDHTQEYKLYEKDFRNNETQLSLSYNEREWQSAEFAYAFGRNFDRDFQLFEGTLNYMLTRNLSLEYSLERLVFEPDPKGESTWIHVIRTTNYFTKDLFLKIFYQTNSSIDKHNIQVLFVWRFQPPFGLVQLAYQKGTARFGVRGTQGNTLFLKFAYMF
ncbi:MAG: carbohydrate binding family 9 domain-containing protein [Candidatus Aminicenantes bacterium]|nr:carbohydrate binding family 9 domain-containing protein [Candidatus Aminicenantes bacterium]